MSDQGVAVKTPTLSKPRHIAGHLLIGHALMVVTLPMVSQVNEKDVPLLGNRVIQSKVSPHTPLA